MTSESPAKDRLKDDITTFKSKIISPSALKQSGFATAKNTKHLKDSQDQLKQVKQRLDSQDLLKQTKQRLKALISDAKNQHKRRVVKKKEVSEFASLIPANASKLRKSTHSTSGRSSLDDTNSDLHKPLSTAGTRADSRRCTDILDACTTLDDLCAVLPIEGYICFSCAAL